MGVSFSLLKNAFSFNLDCQEVKKVDYSRRLLHFFYEIGYLLHLERQRGFVYMAETAKLDRFEKKLCPMMGHALGILKRGLTDEKARMLLDLHKIHYWRNDSYDGFDLIMIQICLESTLLLRRSDWDDFRLFAHEILACEGNEGDSYLLGHLLQTLQKAAHEHRLLSYEQLDVEIRKSSNFSVRDGLSREQIDQLLSEK